MSAIGNSQAGQDNLNKKRGTLSENLLGEGGKSVDGGETTDTYGSGDYYSSYEDGNTTNSSWIVNTTSGNVVPNSTVNVNPTNVTTPNKQPNESIVTSTYSSSLTKSVPSMEWINKKLINFSSSLTKCVPSMDWVVDHFLDYAPEITIIFCILVYLAYRSMTMYNN